MKEKSEFEKRTAEKQVSLLTEALTSAVDAKGHWLNASGNSIRSSIPRAFRSVRSMPLSLPLTPMPRVARAICLRSSPKRRHGVRA